MGVIAASNAVVLINCLRVALKRGSGEYHSSIINDAKLIILKFVSGELDLKVFCEHIELLLISLLVHSIF